MKSKPFKGHHWVAAIACALSVLSFQAIGETSPSQTAQQIGRVESSQGEVYALAKGASQRELHSGSPLFKGDRIKTGKVASAQLVLGANVGLLVKADSELDLNQIDGALWDLRLMHGAVLSTVKNPEKKRKIFQIRTRAAVMGVRGTTLFVQDRDQKPLLFCPCEGVVDASSKDNKDTVTFKSGHVHENPATLIETKDRPLAARLQRVPAGSDPGHTIEEIKDLNALISK